jgi:hypothetical protein
MTPVVYDATVLISADRNSRTVRVEHRVSSEQVVGAVRNGARTLRQYQSDRASEFGYFL